jgi:tRNA (adenine57-N1/adenine58-N1)-methyltransferase
VQAGEFRAGETGLLVDTKGRRYLVTLHPDAEYHSHAGFISHKDVIGRPEGVQVATTRGQKFRVFRPTMNDYVLHMKRGAQVIYPKDLAAILMMADIHPGTRVFETGIGSGAMSMALLRAGAFVTGYEVRDDFAARARKNVEGFLGESIADRYDVHIEDAYAGIDPGRSSSEAEVQMFDRFVLDLPEPWRVIAHAPGALRPGGIIVAYTPSITQAQQVNQALADLAFDEISTTEVIYRTWHIEGQAVRPNHRMVGHTGFLTCGRMVGPSLSSSPAEKGGLSSDSASDEG